MIFNFKNLAKALLATAFMTMTAVAYDESAKSVDEQQIKKKMEELTILKNGLDMPKIRERNSTIDDMQEKIDDGVKKIDTANPDKSSLQSLIENLDKQITALQTLKDENSKCAGLVLESSSWGNVNGSPFDIDYDREEDGSYVCKNLYGSKEELRGIKIQCTKHMNESPKCKNAINEIHKKKGERQLSN